MRGWSDVGYHYGVAPIGEILEGRVDSKRRLPRGAHGKGHNRWLGVVVFGRGTELTHEEKAAIEWLSCPGPAVHARISGRCG